MNGVQHLAAGASSARRKVLVIGLGNSLVGDDGAGPAVIARLNELGLPAGVRAVDGGTDVLSLARMWRGEPEIWLIDGMRSGAAAGTVHRLEHDEVLAVPQCHATAHALSLPESLRWLAMTYPEMATSRFRLWGIEVERLELVEALSPVVAAAVERVAVEVRTELAARRSYTRTTASPGRR